jgi:serine/threonine protein kinase
MGGVEVGCVLREWPRIGPYRVEAPLGQGGTGSVWRARRRDGGVDRAVAIKLLHLSLLGKTSAARFARERAILAGLQHPNIARLLGSGTTLQAQPYLVLEYVDGMRIDRHREAALLTIEQRLRLLLKVISVNLFTADVRRYLT